ncbi:hypothetical protein EAG_11456 [Camponotus floridanus]|uniref:Uncharacterized protein n=1 Tax=Camponotus floridanus TaxID=104421 RepID=E2A9N6_CAMFO|nr:hypothetical protein EAG_11456 [Camponotus floridanus]
MEQFVTVMHRLILNKEKNSHTHLYFNFVRHNSRKSRYLEAKQASRLVPVLKTAAHKTSGRYRLSVVTTTPFVEDYDVVGALFAEANLPRPSPPFLRNPPVKISISTFRSLHRVPRGGIKKVHMLPPPPICTGMLSSTSLLDEVIKDAAAISAAGRANELERRRTDRSRRKLMFLSIRKILALFTTRGAHAIGFPRESSPRFACPLINPSESSLAGKDIKVLLALILKTGNEACDEVAQCIPSLSPCDDWVTLSQVDPAIKSDSTESDTLFQREGEEEAKVPRWRLKRKVRDMVALSGQQMHRNQYFRRDRRPNIPFALTLCSASRNVRVIDGVRRKCHRGKLDLEMLQRCRLIRRRTSFDQSFSKAGCLPKLISIHKLFPLTKLSGCLNDNNVTAWM